MSGPTPGEREHDETPGKGRHSWWPSHRCPVPATPTTWRCIPITEAVQREQEAIRAERERIVALRDALLAELEHNHPEDTPAASPTADPVTIASDAIGLFLEYRDKHGHDEESAKQAAVAEVVEGVAASPTATGETKP